MITIEKLKANKSEIIAIITKEVGDKMVKPVMEQMLKGADCCDSIEELIENAIYMATHFEVRVEKSRNAFILGRLEQIEIENN